MNREEKQDRLNQLKRIVYPSDQELEEMAQLKEELALQTNEESTFTETNVDLGIGKGKVIPVKDENTMYIIPNNKPVLPPKKYKGIISGRIEKWRDQRREQNKPPPATIDEINQLKLELRRAELLRDINEAQAETKTKTRDYWNIFRSAIGSDNVSTKETKPTKSKKTKSKDPYRTISNGLDKIAGKNDKDYSALLD